MLGTVQTKSLCPEELTTRQMEGEQREGLHHFKQSFFGVLN